MFPGLVVLFFLLAGLMAGGYVYKERSHTASERFYVAAVTESRALAAEVKQNLARLDAMVTYFAASDGVRKREFDEFAQGVLSKALQGQTIVWTSVVPAAGLDAFIADIRASNPMTHAGFALDPHGKSLESMEVPGLGLLVGTYSRPETGRRYSGWVLDPKGTTAQTMLQAISNGQPYISSIHLNGDEEPALAGAPSVTLTMPVFSGEGRSRVLKGLVSAFISIPALMGVDAGTPLDPDLHFTILDRDFGSGVVYDLTAGRIIAETEQDAVIGDQARRLREPLQVVNRQWTLVADPADGAFATPLLPSVIAFAVSLIFGIVIARMIWRHGARLEAVEAEAALRAGDADILAGRARQLEADLRQTTDGQRAMRLKCEEAVNRSRHDRRLLESLLNRLPQGVCILDAQARLLAWNRHVAGLLDVSDGTLTKGTEAAALLQQVGEARPLGCASVPVDGWNSFLSEAASAAGEARLELHMRSGLVLGAVRAPGPNGSSMLILSEVGKQAPMELRRKTHYDELTGLMARPRFEDVLSQAMRGRRSTDTGLALVLVDIDEMHVVNDAYGHNVGDEVLAVIADILRRHIREADLAARLDGDRFALLLSAIDDVRMVMGRTEELLQAIWQPLEVQGNKLQLSANMGIAMYPNQAIDPDTLMRLAADALEKAKANKRRNVFIADTVPHTVGTRPSTATKH
jgi:diguanylate cyclase (GGDEF)-like protein